MTLKKSLNSISSHGLIRKLMIFKNQYICQKACNAYITIVFCQNQLLIYFLYPKSLIQKKKMPTY